MKKLAVITVLALTLAISTSVSAQSDSHTANHNVTLSIPQVILLDIEGGSAITLSADAPTEAGDALTFSSNATNNSLWLNYSSIAPSASATRKITAKLDNSAPSGMALKVTAGTYAGSGLGTKGSTAGPKSLTTTATDIVTGIGSCYTQSGANKGHQLTYSLELSASNDAAYSALVQGNTTLSVTYTIVDVE